MDTVGGAQVHVRDMAVGLKKSGHDIYLVTGGEENIHDAIKENKIELFYCKHLIRNLNLPSDIKAVLELRKIVKEIQPDLIATHSSKAGILGRITGWMLGIPTIFTAHGWSYSGGIPSKKRRLYVIFEKIIGRISNGVITVSEYDNELALRHKVLPPEKLIRIHNGVHDIESAKRTKYRDGTPNIIMVARFAPPKKQLELIKALYQIRHIQWNVSFAGDGPLLQEAKSFVHSRGLSDRVSFLGNRQDIKEILHQSDLFVLLSDWEGLPLSILEAMRGSLPIVASDVGGVKEAVIHSENGFLITKDNCNELVEKLVVMLVSPSLRMNMGKRSRQFYEEKFTFENMYSQTVTYYKEMIESKKIPKIQTIH